MIGAAFLIVVGTLWAVPLVAAALAPLRAAIRPPPAPRPIRGGLWLGLGSVECAVGSYRDAAAALTAAGLLIAAPFGSGTAWHGLLLAALALLGRARRRTANRRAIDHVLRQPDVHPDDFFRAVAAWRSPWPPVGEVLTRSIQPHDADFSRGGDRVSPRLALLRAVLDTGLCANLVIQAFGESGTGIGVKVVDAVGRLWSTRTASHLRLRLAVTGTEELLKVRSQAVIVLNHESLLDFCLSFFAVGGVGTAHGRRLAPRFVAAKDHFIDNPLIYRVLGVGRAIEAAGMVFVDRKHAGAARRVVDDAVAVLKAYDVDVAIFPQGTRARPHRGPTGDPFGAGYYTTARGVPGKGHFRKGAALIAAKLAETKDVDIVCVGVVGTAAVIPAGRFQAFPGRTVRYHILPPIHLAAGAPVDEDELTRRIELQLRRTAQVHDRLLRAWQAEASLPDAVRDRIAVALGPWDEDDDPIPYATLDAILSQPPARRAAALADLQALALGGASIEEWTAFRERVATHR